MSVAASVKSNDGRTVAASFVASMFVVVLWVIALVVMYVTFTSDIARVLIVVIAAGTFGGFVHDFTTGTGLSLPYRMRHDDSRAVSGHYFSLHGGFVQNVCVGIVSALVFYGFAAAHQNTAVLGKGPQSANAFLAMTDIAGCLLAGVLGSVALTAYANSKILKELGVKAATSEPDSAAAGTIAKI